MHKEDHKQITDFVIDKFLESFDPKFKAFLEEHGGHLVNGSVVEDYSITLNRHRIKNWHFYKSAESQNLKPFFSPFLGKVQPSSRPRFEKLVTSLHQKHPERNPAGFLKVAGRILHHIQDMSTPSHVLPIFHATFSIWKRYPKRGDHFEDFSIDVIAGCLGVDLVRKQLAEMNSPAEKFIDLYDSSADTTLKYLKSDQAKISGRDIESNDATLVSNRIFWQWPEDVAGKGLPPGWGDYGPCENKFGKTEGFEVEASFVEEKKKSQVTPEGYAHIYSHLVNKMATDTILGLRLVEQLYLNPVANAVNGEGDIY